MHRNFAHRRHGGRELSHISVFVLGDSISIHYGPYLEQYVEGKIKYDRKGKDITDTADINYMSLQNGGDSSHCLEFLKNENQLKLDILLINCGLHDIKTTDKQQVVIDDYKRNLSEIISIMSHRGVRVIWVSSTPVIDEIHNSRMRDFKRYEKDLLAYNETAKGVMDDNGINIIDLYDFTIKLGGDEIFIDHVHFTEEVRKLQGAFIAGQIIGMLGGGGI